MLNRRQMLFIVSAACLKTSRAYAGTWSHESFENDSALDWVRKFEEQPTAAFLRSTLARGTAGKAIESFDGESIIAAAEVVAASLGHPCKAFPQQLSPIVTKFGAKFRVLAPQAKTALAGVLGSKSELRENWSLHADNLSRWEGSVNELLARLSRPASKPPA
ncbi:DUF4259 domain-containing protein [Roseateles sp. P5_E7]